MVDLDAWLALGTLGILEIVLVLIILFSCLWSSPNCLPHSKAATSVMGMLDIMVVRLSLLAAIAWVRHLVRPLFIYWNTPFPLGI